ncbi:MAG: hypothetical protein K6G80_11475 [Treponema sp.]|nr:hypothetical protein [Treponema sp.]
MRFTFFGLFSFLLTGFLQPLSAEFNRLGVPDSAEIRATLSERWFTAPLDAVRETHSELHENNIGALFQVRMEETSSNFAIIVAPGVEQQMDVYTEHGTSRRDVLAYPGDACGSWVLFRDSASGNPQSLVWYITENNDVYVRFTPDRKSARADFIIDGCFVARGVPLGLPFEKLYRMSLAELLRLTGKTLPWQYADIQTGQYHDNLQMIGVIRKNLSRIVYEADAAYDENGNPVRISDGKPRTVSDEEKYQNRVSLSEAGFLKWIIDGLVEPLAGSGTYLAPLVRSTVDLNPVSYAGIVNNGRNSTEGEATYFMLDWNRNLAAARLSAQTKKTYLYNNSGMDVTVEPFNGVLSVVPDATAGERAIAAPSVEQVVGYVDNTGYQIARLRPLLYTLAVTNPTYCYLVAVRRQYPANGKTPEIYKFDHTAIVFPYFNQHGQFRCVVFENGKEVNFYEFVDRYKNSFVYLSRVLTSRNFFPQ